MKRFFQRSLALLLCLLLTAGAVPALAAGTEEPAQETVQEAQRLTLAITGTGYSGFNFLQDNKTGTYYTAGQGAQLTLTAQEGMASLYLMFDLEPGTYTLTDPATGKSVQAGRYGILHEYVDLQAAFGTLPAAVTLDFPAAVRLGEIYAFTQGQLPEYVQQWQPPLDGGADILLLATHGDDDQLFFAGLMPLYAGEKGLRLQVAYLTDHRNSTNVRTHEMINGLWAVGVTAYPVFGTFADFRIDSLSQTYQRYENMGVSKDMLLQYVVGLLRRFKPQVAVGHDFAGEYGHGMHQLYAALLKEALELSGDAQAYPDLAQQYGTWEVPKAYFHLYEENPIVIDYDTPLERFDGLTAFQVSQKLGFPCHKSQQDTWFRTWLNGSSKAAEIKNYNPCKFGLLHSTVGPDVAKNDFMENIVSYAEQERLEAERLEQERLEAERLEAERLEAERLEAERLEAERLEAERKEQEARQKKGSASKKDLQQLLLWALGLGGGLVLLVVLILLLRPKKRRRRRGGRYAR